MKRILLLITLIVPGITPAQAQVDTSIIQVLKAEHDKNCCTLPKKNRYGTTNGKLLVATKKATVVLNFDSTKNELLPDCLGDVDFALCKQSYRLYATNPDNVLIYETFKCSNHLSLMLDGLLYSIGDVDLENTFKPILIDGLSFRYEYKDDKKFLNLKATKNIKLELDLNGHRLHTIMEAEHLSFKQAKKRYRPVTILKGSTVTICVRD